MLTPAQPLSDPITPVPSAVALLGSDSAKGGGRGYSRFERTEHRDAVYVSPRSRAKPALAPVHVHRPNAAPLRALGEDAMPRLTEVEHFLALSETRCFNAAAERVDRSSHDIRRSLARLQERLGAALFEAPTGTDRALRLTRAGVAFNDACRAVQRELYRMSTVVSRAERARGGLAPWQLRRVTDHLLDNLTQTVRLNELAALVSLSPAHLCNAFKESTGLPPHRWQIKRRIEQSQHLMLTTDLSLIQIALECGFPNHGHFSTDFRKLVGMTPVSWRRQFFV